MSTLGVWTQIYAVTELVLAQYVPKLHKGKPSMGAQLSQLMLCAMLEVSTSR